MRSSSLFVLCSFVASVFASPTAPHVLHEKRHRLPHNWVKRGKLDQKAVIPLRIAMKQRNIERAEDFMYDVSHPHSEKYGQHWTAKDVADMFAPSMDDVDTVKVWLNDNGISEDRVELSRSKNWLVTDVTVDEAERLLKTEYFVFQHTKSGTPQLACSDYHLPAHISDVVDFITPTVHFDAKVPVHGNHKRSVKVNEKRNAVKPGTAARIGSLLGSLPKQGAQVADDRVRSDLDHCDQQTTPECLRALYQFKAGKSAQPGNSLGIVEYTPQSFLPSDLDKFFANFSSKLVGSRPIVDSIDGGQPITYNQSFETNGESDLDIEVAMVLIAPQTVTVFQTGDLVQGGSFNNFLDAIDASYCHFEGGDDPTQDGVYPDPPNGYIGPENCGGFAPTNVISTSYGYNEVDLTPKYEQRQCLEYMKLALQGITVLYSSGDYGVAGNGDECIDPATGNLTAPGATSGQFNPSFPSTCPWITSVGATQVINGTNVQNAIDNNQQPEQACEIVIRSGGGFSNNFAMPLYQAAAVDTWWREHYPQYGSDRFNNSQVTRGYPDVAANGANYVIAVDGKFSLVYGTSASAPAFASIITLINEERLKKGKNPVGFLNHVLYANPDMMKDVTVGSNPGCGTDGFPAVPGWDPVTGLGTPVYPKMKDVFMSLP